MTEMPGEPPAPSEGPKEPSDAEAKINLLRQHSAAIEELMERTAIRLVERGDQQRALKIFSYLGQWVLKRNHNIDLSDPHDPK